MDMSQLAFQGYLEKTGMLISESEYIAKNANYAYSSYLENVAEMIPIVGKKEAKAEAARSILLSNLITSDTGKNFMFMKAFISVISYQFAEEANFNEHLTFFSNNDKCRTVLQDANLMGQIKDQFIASKAIGSKKGIWSKIFG